MPRTPAIREENAAREMAIVNVGENNFRQVVEAFYGRI